MDSVSAKKAALRREYAAMRDGIPPQERERAGLAIARRLSSLPQYIAADTVYCYVSFGSEPDTRAIISGALAEGKKVACPRCSDRRGYMDFYFIDSLSQLVPGSFGIPEPDTGQCEPALPPFGGLCVVPGLSFDTGGGRLGYGGGYYDRFLPLLSGHAVGICFDRALRREPLPSGGFDRRVSVIVTEHRVLDTTV